MTYINYEFILKINTTLSISKFCEVKYEEYSEKKARQAQEKAVY